VPELIEYCRANGLPLDFVSTHTYGVRGDFDAFGTAVLYLLPQPHVVQHVREVAEQVRDLAGRNDGRPFLCEAVPVGKDGRFSRRFDMKQNDVCRVVLKRQEQGIRGAR